MGQYIITYVQNPPLNTYVDVSSGVRNLSIGMISALYMVIPINDTSFELSVFWPSDTENRINELSFSVSLSFKTRLMAVTCFCEDVT